MKTHNLKILPKYFHDLKAGIKTFEVRLNDRDFQVGDLCLFEEWNGEYSDRKILKRIVYILDDSKFMKENYVVLGLECI